MKLSKAVIYLTLALTAVSFQAVAGERAPNPPAGFDQPESKARYSLITPEDFAAEFAKAASGGPDAELAVYTLARMIAGYTDHARVDRKWSDTYGYQNIQSSVPEKVFRQFATFLNSPDQRIRDRARWEMGQEGFIRAYIYGFNLYETYNTEGLSFWRAWLRAVPDLTSRLEDMLKRAGDRTQRVFIGATDTHQADNLMYLLGRRDYGDRVAFFVNGSADGYTRLKLLRDSTYVSEAYISKLLEVSSPLNDYRVQGAFEELQRIEREIGREKFDAVLSGSLAKRDRFSTHEKIGTLAYWAKTNQLTLERLRVALNVDKSGWDRSENWKFDQDILRPAIERLTQGLDRPARSYFLAKLALDSTDFIYRIKIMLDLDPIEMDMIRRYMAAMGGPRGDRVQVSGSFGHPSCQDLFAR